MSTEFHPLDAQDMSLRAPLVGRLVVRLFGRTFNHWVASPVLCRAHERGIISSAQLHTLSAQFDSTQRGLVGLLTRGRLRRRAV